MPMLLAAALAAVLTTTACPVQNRPARIVQSVAADYPPIADVQDANGITIVRVALANTGDVVATTVLQSSGNRILDAEALRVARVMAYAPEVRDCETVAGTYALQVAFPTLTARLAH